MCVKWRPEENRLSSIYSVFFLSGLNQSHGRPRPHLPSFVSRRHGISSCVFFIISIWSEKLWENQGDASRNTCLQGSGCWSVAGGDIRRSWTAWEQIGCIFCIFYVILLKNKQTNNLKKNSPTIIKDEFPTNCHPGRGQVKQWTAKKLNRRQDKKYFIKEKNKF